jgi:hypothetical protein
LRPEDIPALIDRQRPASGLQQAVNIDIDRNGWPKTRPVWENLDADVSKAGFTLGGHVWAVLNGAVVELLDDSVRHVKNVSGQVSWAVLNDEPVFADYSGIYVIRNGVATQFTHSTSIDARDDRILATMPGGVGVGAWRGRLVVARGTSLYFSEPVHFGAYDAMRGILGLGKQIRWIQALESGIFVGFRNTVEFLGGSNPFDLERKTVDDSSWDAPGIIISTKRLSLENVSGPWAVAWFGSEGFVVGTEGGAIQRPQKERITELGAHKGILSYNDGRLLVRKTQLGA